jgi:hypothetical protein
VGPVEAILKQATADLDAIGARWAIIGGLAVAVRSEPRFTKDVDLAVAVADDREAEDLVNRMQFAATRSAQSLSRITRTGSRRHGW